MNSVPVGQCDVLYIDLENGHRRIQRRVEALFPNPKEQPDLSRLEFVTQAPALNEGFIEELERWRQSVVAPTLVVIDVLQRRKPAGVAARNAYENDYSILAELQQWATEHGVAVVALHHTRKGGADDPLEALSGSNGLSACADATLVLDRDGNGTTLYVRGRDVEEKETAVRFDAGWWTVLGEAADVRRSDERSRILEALNESAEAMSPRDIVAATGMKEKNVSFLLTKMAQAGEVERPTRGLYATLGTLVSLGTRPTMCETPANRRFRPLRFPSAIPGGSCIARDAARNAKPCATGIPSDTSVPGGVSDEALAMAGIRIMAPAVEVGADEYDGHLDTLIAALPAGSDERNRLDYTSYEGWCVERGGTRIFTRGRT